jgi:hypothetical protein
VLQVLVDADNVPAGRLLAVMDAVSARLGPATSVTVAGHPEALAAVDWPDAARVVPASGWQRADVVLAAAYRPDDGPLVVVSGDGDFGLLAARHPGPVLVVSQAPSVRLREAATVVDPAFEGVERITDWLRAVLPAY